MKNALLVTNLRARSVSPRVKAVIQKALSAEIDLKVADTAARNHATELAAQAAAEGFDLVVSFGGDGTMNEVLNGLAGTETALAILPGGMANVMCRTLGIPTDIVEATGLLLNRIKNGTTRTMNLGRIDDRYFLMSCGLGVDAATVRHTEKNPVAKRRYRDWFFLYSAFKTSFTEYRNRDPYIWMDSGEVSEKVLVAIISNIKPFTYFKNLPIIVTPQAKLDSGLDVFSMRRFPMTYIPTLLWSTFVSGSHIHSKHATYLHDIASATFRSESGEPIPVQLDGEYIGERLELKVELVNDGLKILT
ncbi:MAG: diacylglycerol kinase family protein [Actinomycetota bacterium]